MCQDRKGARTDPNHVRRTLGTPKPPQLYPPTDPMIDDTHEELFHLEHTLLRHGIAIEGNLGQGVATSGIGPSHIEDPLRSLDPTRSRDHIGHVEGSERHVMTHNHTTCRNIFYGPSSYFCGDGLH